VCLSPLPARAQLRPLADAWPGGAHQPYLRFVLYKEMIGTLDAMQMLARAAGYRSLR
jgi:tRNA(Glu) U13 pseudouridine synthase TruD